MPSDKIQSLADVDEKFVADVVALMDIAKATSDEELDVPVKSIDA